MSIFSSMQISASALTAQRARMDVIAKNIANANTTRTQSGDPYRRQITVLSPSAAPSSFKETLAQARLGQKPSGTGVEVTGIVSDESEFPMVYDPGHPDADENGYVAHSNVNMVTEMVDMISAQRSYEANATALSTTRSMLMKALDIGR